MAIAVLKTTAARSGSELAWMQEERDAIEQAARGLLDAMPDATALRDALTTYTDGVTNSLYLDDAQADYARASEVLSCAIEAAYASGNAEHIATVIGLMDQRHAHQQEVTGQFMAAGRA
jgi:hypothetical protein